MRTSDRQSLVERQLLRPIRDFLAHIDSKTGYLE